MGAEIDGRYCIVRAIGSGGMGHVYEALDRVLERRLALKVLAPELARDPKARTRMLREGRAAARVVHPGIVQIYEVGSDGDIDYVAMQLLEGEDLEAHIAREGPLPIAKVIQFGAAIADAMAAMHRAGIIHRDLKPKNIFLAREGGLRDVPKLLDFGVAKGDLTPLDTLTDTGDVFGTLHYMAPEAFRGARHADARSDLWSAGVILYQMLTGRVPYEASTGPELVLKVVTEAPPAIAALRADVPPLLIALVERALTRKPEQRLQTAEELRDALRSIRLLEQLDTTIPSGSYAPHGMALDTTRPRQGLARPKLGMLLAVVLLVSATYWLVARTPQASSTEPAPAQRTLTGTDAEPVRTPPLRVQPPEAGTHPQLIELAGDVEKAPPEESRPPFVHKPAKKPRSREAVVAPQSQERRRLNMDVPDLPSPSLQPLPNPAGSPVAEPVKATSAAGSIDRSEF